MAKITNPIWIIVDKKLLEIDKESPKLNWAYPNPPEGSVKYTPRANSTKWSYASFGDTKEQALAKENAWVMKEIKALEDKIEALKLRLVKDETSHQEPV